MASLAFAAPLGLCLVLSLHLSFPPVPCPSLVGFFFLRLAGESFFPDSFCRGFSSIKLIGLLAGLDASA